MMSAAPTMEGYHFFGTDASGRDLLVRTAIGGRISIGRYCGCFHFRDYRNNLWGDFRLCRRQNRYVNDAFLEILSSFPFMFS